MSIDQQKNFDCVAAAEHMHEYLDGELKPDWRAAMERHLAGCADCAATFTQLRRIETAHQQLDARLASPPEEYWQALPQRVMEKVKVSEKRRLLALPKLPRLKSPVKRAEPAPKQDWLYLSPAVQKFLRGPAKYILPLAAVAAFCFFMIGELRQKSEGPIMTASVPEPPQAEAQSARDESLLEKSIASKSAPALESPREKSAAETKTVQPGANAEVVRSRDTLLAVIDQTRGEGAGLRTSGQSLGVAGPAAAVPQINEPKPVSLAEAQPQAAETDVAAPELKQTQSLVATPSKAKDQPAAPLEKEVRYRTETPADLKAETESKIADDRLAQSAESRAKKVSTAGRMGVSSTAMRSVSNRYNETQQRAQQTSDLKKREKIWRDFLKSNPDSSSRTMATAEIARTLAASSDSMSKPEQLEKNIAFYREHAITLRAQIGAAEYDRELARLQMLLNFRKSK